MNLPGVVLDPEFVNFIFFKFIRKTNNELMIVILMKMYLSITDTWEKIQDSLSMPHFFCRRPSLLGVVIYALSLMQSLQICLILWTLAELFLECIKHF